MLGMELHIKKILMSLIIAYIICCLEVHIVQANTRKTRQDSASSDQCGKPFTNQYVLQPRRSPRQIFTPILSHLLKWIPGKLIGDTQNPVIAGGMDASIFDWPWMAGIYTNYNGVENFLCGSSIINSYYLVTAAHCFGERGSSSPPADYTVRIGSNRVNEGEQYLIEKITVHPNYTTRESYHDIAVIKLRSPIHFGPEAQPICLPTTLLSNRLKGRHVIVAGWGTTQFGHKHSQTLKDVTVQVVPTPACDNAYKQRRLSKIPRGITSHFICAGVPEGGKDACQNDSGSPLMLEEYGLWYLVGVVSFGFECGAAGYPGVYTRVTHYLGWLQKQTSQF